MTTPPWAPYRPSATAPWNLERAWTLRRRAGFAATWPELERDVADGPGPAVDRVFLMAFSEFGRRPDENGSLGTDHGTAGPAVLAGSSLNPGLFGKTPPLGDLEDGNLKWSTDFRSVYATLLSDWLRLPADQILGGKFAPVPLLKA